MQFQTFCHMILEEARARIPDKVPAIRKVLKNNDVEQIALYMKHPDTLCTPMVYLESYYEGYLKGLPLTQLYDEILRYFEIPYPAPSFYRFLHELTDPKPYLRIRLIHHSQNRRQLSEVPYEQYLDLAAVCELSIETGDLDGTALIHTHHLQEWGITKETLFAAAWKNSIAFHPPILRPIEEPLFFYEETNLASLITGKQTDIASSDAIPRDTASLQEICRRWLSMMHNASCPLFSLSNAHCFHGAVCMLYPGVLSQIADGFGADLYLIPSSIHEVLLTPILEQDHRQVLTTILQEVNAESVPQTEILGIHLYRYDHTGHRLLALSDGSSDEILDSLSL